MKSRHEEKLRKLIGQKVTTVRADTGGNMYFSFKGNEDNDAMLMIAPDEGNISFHLVTTEEKYGTLNGE